MSWVKMADAPVTDSTASTRLLCVTMPVPKQKRWSPSTSMSYMTLPSRLASGSMATTFSSNAPLYWGFEYEIHPENVGYVTPAARASLRRSEIRYPSIAHPALRSSASAAFFPVKPIVHFCWRVPGFVCRCPSSSR